ncbi:MAG TPA: M28 family peptidase, partial [Pyrinomonadaceae bacterium]|nr:M28 family peptidase [Pyrinomonadaceae bacterium]
AFVNQHPWSKDVGLVLNFEARGVTGPSIMFETSEGNGWLMRQAAQAAPGLVASSFSYDVYKLLPNDTDLTVFKQAGFAGFNFAFIDGSQHYHAPTDDLAHLDQRSLQQHGSNALSFTRHFGSLDLTNTRTDDVVYFNLPGSGLIIYSGKLVIPLTLAVSILFVACIAIGYRRKRLTIQGMSSGFTAFLISAGAGIFAVIVVRVLADMLGGMASVSDKTVLLMSGIAIAAVTAAVYLRFSRKTSAVNLMAGGIVWWLILALLTGLFLPGASYLFVWPLLFITFGLMLAVLFSPQTLWTTIVIGILTAPAILLITPSIYLLFMAMTIESLLFAIVAAVFAALVVVPFIPLLHVVATHIAALLPARS